MASSSKLVVTRDGLKGMIDKSWQARIDKATKAREDHFSEEVFLDRLVEWRKDAKQRVTDLAERIKAGVVDDGELDGFSVPSAPSRPSRYELRSEDRRVEEAMEGYQRALSRWEGMKFPESGEREFTEAQLVNLFGV